MREIASHAALGPFGRKEHDTILEVFEYCDLSAPQEALAWSEISRRWHDTSGRFYAYNTAHVVAADVLHGRVATG